MSKTRHIAKGPAFAHSTAVLAVLVLLFSCAEPERNNPYDEPSSSSSGEEPSSSSDIEEPSSSSAEPSSSSAEPSSSSEVESSSSSSFSSSSSSSVAASSSSSVPSSSSLGGGFSYGLLPYEGYTYKTVVIGTQTWFAENLNYNVEGSRCNGDNTGDDSQNMCSTYGRLYDWETAKTVCPSGWRLPTKDDLEKLSSYVKIKKGCNSCDAKLLTAASGWNSNGNGTDDYGFSALPGGYGNSGGSFDVVGDGGSWWSASGNYIGYAYGRYMSYRFEDSGFGSYDKSYLLSVRCLQD
jgi:uncharacterized protein (TIGR02145 family)